MGRPLISVLITSYNRENYIAEAIESVLDSTYENFELIIVDDCSKDKTVEIARQYERNDARIKIFVNEINLGDYPNRNKAASFASGKYLKYVDADDKVYKNALAIYVAAMELNDDCGFGLSLEDYNLTNTSFKKITSQNTLYSFFKYKGVFNCGPTGSIIRKDCFDEVGGFSGMQFISDIELWIELAKLSPLLIIQGGLVYWRIHNEQQMYKGLENDEQFVRNAKLTIRQLFSSDIPLSLMQRISCIYSVYRYLIVKFFMLTKSRSLKYALSVYNRILVSAW